MEYSGAGGKLIHKKNQKQKISWHCPFNVVFTLPGWCSNFVGSESGQKQSVKLLQNIVYSTIQHPPPQAHTLSVYVVHLVWEGGRGGVG